MKWKRIPNKREIDMEKFRLHFNDSIGLINPKRGFMELMGKMSTVTKIDISYSEFYRFNFCGSGAIFSYAGISSSIHKKTLDLLREKRNENNAAEEIWFKFSEQLYNWTWGHWKISSENDIDENLLNSALKIGEAQNTTL